MKQFRKIHKTCILVCVRNNTFYSWMDTCKSDILTGAIFVLIFFSKQAIIHSFLFIKRRNSNKSFWDGSRDTIHNEAVMLQSLHKSENRMYIALHVYNYYLRSCFSSSNSMAFLSAASSFLNSVGIGLPSNRQEENSNHRIKFKLW